MKGGMHYFQGISCGNSLIEKILKKTAADGKDSKSEGTTNN